MLTLIIVQCSGNFSLQCKLLKFDNYPQLGKLFSSGIITQDGETIGGGGLEGVIVLGKVTALIVSVYEPLRSTI